MQFQDLFPAYTRQHGRFPRLSGQKDKRGKAIPDPTVPGPYTAKGVVTPEQWAGHLSGKGTGLGLIPLLDDNKSTQWGAIDIDVYPLDPVPLVRDIENLPLTLTRTKSDGAHLWLFLKEPVPAVLVVEKLTEWATALGYGKSEIFPKQTSRELNRDDVGNWINLPYYGDTRHAVHNGKEIGLDQFVKLAGSRRISKEQLEDIAITLEGRFEDGPPCLQVLDAHGGAPEGTRNNFIFSVGLYMKAKYPDRWQEELRDYNRTSCDPPLGETEVSTIIGSLTKKKYNYHCNKAPLCTHCNRALCVKREFGVAHNSSSSAEFNLVLSGLTKLTTTPPRWYLNIDGVRVELADTKDLEQDRFRIKAIETVHKVPNPVPRKKWDQLIQGLLDSVEIVEAPPEASANGQLVEHLVRFIELNQQKESRDLLLNGRVFVDDATVYFRSIDLLNYLKRERFQDLKGPAIYSQLADRGLEKGHFSSKGSKVAYWQLDRARLEQLQGEVFDAPEFKDPFGGGEKQ